LPLERDLQRLRQNSIRPYFTPTLTRHHRHNLNKEDIDIVGNSQSSVRDTFFALGREAAKVGLKINEQKKKYLIAARNDTTIRDVWQNVAIGDKQFEVVKEFVYLGSLMTPTNDVSLEIQGRIQTANRCCFGLCKPHKNLTIHKTLIRPVVLCGSESWDVDVDQKGREPIARI
jgi:hypothetical protein